MFDGKHSAFTGFHVLPRSKEYSRSTSGNFSKPSDTYQFLYVTTELNLYTYIMPQNNQPDKIHKNLYIKVCLQAQIMVWGDQVNDLKKHQRKCGLLKDSFTTEWNS